MTEFLEANSSVQRRLGALPYEWLEKIEPAKISKVTQTVFDTFTQFAKEIRFIRVHRGNMTDSHMNLLDVLKKVLQRNDISIAPINDGKFKNCTKISVGDKSYALSTFKSLDFNPSGYPSHGQAHEPQMSFLIKKRGSQGRFARPFLARLGSMAEEANSFILSKFIEKDHDVKMKLNPILRSREAVTSVDEIGNTINGIVIDAGGFTFNDMYIKDPKIRANWRRFAHKLDSESNIVLIPCREIDGRYVDVDKVQNYLLKLKAQGLDLCKSDSREILKELSPEEQKFGRKYLRILRKTRKLKEELIFQGEFERYQQLLHDDLQEIFPFRFYSADLKNVEIRRGYPKLVADELGVNNIPDNMHEFVHLISIGAFEPEALPKYLTRERLVDWLKSDCKNVEYEDFIEAVRKQFKLDAEIKAALKKIELKREEERKLNPNPYDFSKKYFS